MKSFSLHPSTLHSGFWAARSLAHLNRFRLTHRPTGLFVEQHFQRWRPEMRKTAADALAKMVRTR